jgi:hypothetical protein
MCAGPGPIAASATSVSRRRGGPIGGTSQSAAIGEKRKPTPSHAHVVKRRALPTQQGTPGVASDRFGPYAHCREAAPSPRGARGRDRG